MMDDLRRKLKKELSSKAARVEHAGLRVLDRISDGIFTCRSSEGRVAIAISVDKCGSKAISTDGFRALEMKSAECSYGSKSWISDVISIEAMEGWNESFHLNFFEDLIRRASKSTIDSRAEEIWACIDEWSRFFRSRRNLTREEELGLWGELWFINEADDTRAAVEAWSGPDADEFDFKFQDCRIEIKCAKKRHEHHFSLAQMVRNRIDFFVGSLTTVENPSGMTVEHLVASISSKLENPIQLYMKLGSVLVDGNRDFTHFSLAETPSWFKSNDLPTIGELDPMIIGGRLIARLDPKRMIDPNQLPVRLAA